MLKSAVVPLQVMNDPKAFENAMQQMKNMSPDEMRMMTDMMGKMNGYALFCNNSILAIQSVQISQVENTWIRSIAAHRKL